MNKKIRILAIFLTLPIIALVILNGHQIKEILKEKSRKEGIEQRKQIAQLYKHDNNAFGIESSLEYRDFSYVDVNLLTLHIAVYEDNNPDAAEVTIHDIEDYLSSEYDEKGKLRVLNQPKNIADFVLWYSYVGTGHTLDLISCLRNYSKDHYDKYQDIGIFEMDIDMLNELIDDYRNCPNKDDYKEF
ncbi:hypothetical protein [Butyrivibrio proteoclasticus]|uniref:hypothetical protein n=1 Tax=Butyrivibrio proteoclasticus TaxID=43305 RepID=UPI00047B2CE3|nr:hypothetical protein [Butyrivibrio proteoclasticus]